MRRLGLALAFLAVPALWNAPARAVPESGLYYQPIPGTSGNIQASAPDGTLQLDYAPVLSRPAGGTMQVLQGALRLPAPLLDAPLSLDGLLGYRHLLAIYGGAPQESYGGIEAGLSASLPLRDLVGRGNPLSAVSLYAFGFHHQLFLALAPGGAMTTNALGMQSFGAGVTLQLPTTGVLTLGWETWALPQDLGTGTPAFAQGVRPFSGFAIGYRW